MNELEPQRAYKNKAELFRHKAEQAKQLADEAHRKYAETLIKRCEEEATKGQYSFSDSGSLAPATVAVLKQEGFKVTHDSQRNESYYTISW